MRTKLITLLTFFLSVLIIHNLSADEKKSNTDMCKINIELIPEAIYKPNRIPIRVIFTNAQEKPIRLLKLTSKKDTYLNALWVTCYDKNGLAKTNSGTSFITPPGDDLLEYISLNPKDSFCIDVDLNGLLRPPLKPGKYRLELEYHNSYGDKCVKGSVKAENELAIVIAGPDNEFKKGYFSKEEVIPIAQKAHNMNYDKSKPLEVYLDEGTYTVIFSNKLTPGARVGDYAAKVKIDAKTGKVLQVLAGS